mgnify:CR=1 FL=1
MLEQILPPPAAPLAPDADHLELIRYDLAHVAEGRALRAAVVLIRRAALGDREAWEAIRRDLFIRTALADAADALGQVRDAAAGAWESLTSGGGSSWWDQWSPSTVTKPPERSPDKSGNY